MAATFDIFATVKEGVEGEFNRLLEDREKREKVVAAMVQWLAVKARKKPVADLDARLQLMQKRLTKMVEAMSFEIKDDELVVKAAGSDEETLKWFRLGSEWFEANPDLMETILSGLFNE